MKRSLISRAWRAGWAAAAVTAALCATVLATPGQAAAASIPASSFNLKTGTDLSSQVAALKAALPTQGLEDLLNQANRVSTSGSACTTNPFGTGDGGIAPLAPVTKYCWNSGDSLTKEWIPQAVTGVSDAEASEFWGTKRPVVAGWYDDNTYCPSSGSDACHEKGIRLSFLDPATGKYRLVLLVSPFINSANHISYQAINIHAGGIAWYKNYLYVADTLHGLRVFDMRDILDLDPDNNPATNNATADGLTSNVQDTQQLGRQNNVWYSYSYRYVMPQVASYNFASTESNSGDTCVATGAPKASYISVDRSSTPPQLIMGEYCTTDSTHTAKGRVGTLPINDADGLLQASNGVVSALNAYTIPEHQIQGAARYDGRWFFNESHGFSNGSLWQAFAGSDGTLALVGEEIRTGVGPEDLYFEHGQGTGAAPLLWSLTEHAADTPSSSCATSDPTPCGRVLYAQRVSDITADAPPPSVCSTVSTDFTAYPAISSGATGAAVKAAQCLLQNAGFPTGSGDPTGTFDAGTVSAVKAFQTSRGMTADGAIGSHAWTALLSVGATTTLSEGATGAAVSRLQRSLTAALSRTVSIDGDFGPLTTQAVKDYQTSRGLGVDGIVGSQTWTALQAGK